jgi:nucleoside-diphosphate-sugar epimerase
MGAFDRPPSSSGVAEDAGGRPPSSSGDAAESDADLAVTARVVDFSGVRAWLPRADTRLSRVLGTALRDAGCAVHGARAGGEELAFATETFVAATELHNPEHERARRACVRACHLAVATLPGDAGEIRSLAEALTSAARADGTKRALIVVSPPRAVVGRSASASASSASSTASREKRDGKKDEAARSPPGAAGVCADAERVALRLHRPGSLEVFVMRHGVLYGEGEFADGFLSVMRAAWEGRSVPVFGVGDNVLRLCHARKLAEGVVRVAARALLGVVMPSDRAKQTTPFVFSNADAREEGDGAGESGDEADRDDRSAARPSAVAPPDLPRVLGVCDATDAGKMTQIEIASQIARAFETTLRRFPASRAALFDVGARGADAHHSRFVRGLQTLEDGRGGCESLLLRFEEDADADAKTLARLAKAEEESEQNANKNKNALSLATGKSASGMTGGTGTLRGDAPEPSRPRAVDPGSHADATFAASARAFASHFPGAAETNPLRFGEAFGAFSFEDAHFGSMGEPVPHPFFNLIAARAAAAAEAERQKALEAEAEAGPEKSSPDAEEPAEPEEPEEETFWEPAPVPLGGARAVRDAFVRENGLEPPRVVLRGPPLSRVDHLGAAVAKAYSVPLLTPASMVRAFLPRAPDELREKCGDPTWKPPAEAEAAEAAEAAAEAAEDSPPLDPSALARAEARADEEAHALFDGLDGGAKLELLAFVLDDARVKKTGYVMAGGAPADPETCAALFTRVPPRPPLRLKEGWDKPDESGEAGQPDASTGADADAEPAEPPPPPEEPPYPEETEEEAEARREAHPDRAPNLHLRLVFDDGGAYAKKVKRSDPEGYAAYVAWAEAEDAARDAFEAATEAREEAVKAKEAAKAEKLKNAKDAGEPAPDASALAEEFPDEPEVEPVETDEVSKWLFRERGIARVDVEASEGDDARLAKAKRALGDRRPRNFAGFPVDPEDDPLHPATLEKAQDLVARRREEDEAFAARAERAAKLVQRRERELLARETETLHQRSASLRRYLRDAVMPAVTDAMVTLARVRPEDPVEALAEWLIRTDKKREAEEEAERVALEAMERAVAEEERLREKERKLAASRRAAAAAQAAIKPRSVVRKVPVIPTTRRVVAEAAASRASSVKSQRVSGEE